MVFEIVEISEYGNNQTLFTKICSPQCLCLCTDDEKPTATGKWPIANAKIMDYDEYNKKANGIFYAVMFRGDEMGDATAKQGNGSGEDRERVAGR